MTSYCRNEHRMCQDCGHDTARMGELYMVQHDLWIDVIRTTGFADMLCIGCFELRLGRLLNSTDFIDCPLNTSEDWARSLRLRQRLLRVDSADILDTESRVCFNGFCSTQTTTNKEIPHGNRHQDPRQEGSREGEGRAEGQDAEGARALQVQHHPGR